MWYMFRVEDRARGIKLLDEALEGYQTQMGDETLPRDFAIFSIQDLAANAVTFYFPPGAALLAANCAASPCDRPPAAGLDLLAGAEEAWELFPDRVIAS